MTGPVEVALLARRLPRSRAKLTGEIEAAVTAAAAAVGAATPALSVVVVGDRRMRRLNRDFHDADRTTDVLAFPLDDDQDGTFGEVIVCAPEAYRQAARRGLPASTELLLYVVHGTLHLLGEDDHERSEALEMRRLERDALAAIGHELPVSHLSELK